MKRWQWVLLICELALIALILILPQVALPDFTFHAGTAPVAIKARLSAAPGRIVVAVPVHVFFSHQVVGSSFLQANKTLLPVASESSLELLCILIC